MTYSVGRHVFFGARMVVCAGMLSLPFAASGCTSTNTTDAGPALAGGRGAQDTGTYPNLNIAPKVAAPQLTDDQKTAKLAELEAAKRRQGGKGVVAGGDSKAMTTLAREHGADTLKAIQGKCDPIDPACN